MDRAGGENELDETNTYNLFILLGRYFLYSEI